MSEQTGEGERGPVFIRGLLSWRTPRHSAASMQKAQWELQPGLDMKTGCVLANGRPFFISKSFSR